MAGKALNFDTGIVEYTINDKATVSFNPTDTAFADRFYETMEKLEAQNEEIKTQAESITEPRQLLDFMKSRDASMRADIDALLGEGVADAVFGDMNCYSMAGGLPLWLNMFFAIAEEVGGAWDKEQKKTDPRLKSYQKKYDDLLNKYKPKTPDRQSHR